MSSSRFLRALVFAVLIGAAVISADAQTTIFNIPTADTLSRGSWNLEFDFITKPISHRDGGYQVYGYRVAYGVTNNTEVGGNFYYTRSGDPGYGQVEFSLKQKLYQNEKYGVTVSGGTVVVVPMRNRTVEKDAAIVYANARKTIEPLNGMTVTGGAYHVFGGSKAFGTKTGAMVGLVQPIAGRVSFVADWFSGNNRLGYGSAGVNVNVTKSQYLLTGWSFGNSGRGNNAFAAYYGITF